MYISCNRHSRRGTETIIVQHGVVYAKSCSNTCRSRTYGFTHASCHCTGAGSHGEHIRLTSADLHLQRIPVRASQNMRITPRNRITGCHVATVALGLAHSALWGLALGGPVGLGAGTAVGAFWWAVGTQC